MTVYNSEMTKRKGYFIAVEGIDGMGKTTQVDALESYFVSLGVTVCRTKEPTDSSYGKDIRQIAQQGREGISLEQELELFIKDREIDVQENIAPGLDKGSLVLVDRYFYSNIAYQGALGLDPMAIRKANETRFPIPDLVLLLDAPPSVGISRIRHGRGEVNNQGYEQEDFLESVRIQFLAMSDPSIVRFDAAQSLEIITQAIRDLVWHRVQGRLELFQPNS